MPPSKLRVLLLLCPLLAVSLEGLRPAYGAATNTEVSRTAVIASAWPPSNGARVAGATAFLTFGFFWLFRTRVRLGFWATLHLGLILAVTAGLIIGWGSFYAAPDQSGRKSAVPSPAAATTAKLPAKIR